MQEIGLLSHHLQIPDAIIGATAVIHQIPFYTYNTKDFDFIPGIHTVNLNSLKPLRLQVLHHVATAFYIRKSFTSRG
jgi:hypothetical protein